VRSNGQLGGVVPSGDRGMTTFHTFATHILMVMDWVLKRALDDNKSGIQWLNDVFITDLDFANDIALLEDSWQGMADITTRVEREAAIVGLRINAGKTKLMVIGNMSDKRCIMAECQIVETVEEFCYLKAV